MKTEFALDVCGAKVEKPDLKIFNTAAASSSRNISTSRRKRKGTGQLSGTLEASGRTLWGSLQVTMQARVRQLLSYMVPGTQ